MRLSTDHFENDDARDLGLDPSDAAALAGFLFGTEVEAPKVRIGPYTVIREIGRGGHGVVLLAHQEGEERLVAIKVLRGDQDDPRSTRRLWRELESLERCRTACVPRLLEYGTSDGKHFIVYEYVKGEPFDEYVAAHARTMSEKVQLLIRACDAVQSLHEHGIIHRDLKPSNLLVTAEGEIRIIDLGTACLVEGRADQTRTIDGTVLGTPACMPPEQARGEVSRISTRSDVFSLGALGYLIFAGQPPFDPGGTAMEVVHRVATGTPRRLDQLDPGVDRSLAAVLTRAAAQLPEERFGTVVELREELQRVRDGVPTRTAPPNIARRTVMYARRKPLVAVVALLCVSTFVFGLMAWHNGVKRRALSEGVSVHASAMKDLGLHSQVMIAADNGDKVWMPLAMAALYVHNGGDVEEALDDFGKAMTDLIEHLRKEGKIPAVDGATMTD